MKMSYNLIEKIRENKYYKNTIKVILELIRVQQEDGSIYNVSTSDLSITTGVDSRNVRLILDKLHKDDVVEKCRIKNGYYDITINDNNFSGGQYIDYININRDMFGDDFYTLKPCEMYVVFEHLKRTRDNNTESNTCKSSEATIAEYANIKPTNKRVISRVMDSISKFVANGKQIFDVSSYINKRNQLIYNVKLTDSLRTSGVYESSVQASYLFKSFCRCRNIKHSDKDIIDLVQMYHSYKEHLPLYYGVVKEILLQYKQVQCKVIRKIMDDAYNYMSMFPNRTHDIINPCDILR